MDQVSQKFVLRPVIVTFDAKDKLLQLQFQNGCMREYPDISETEYRLLERHPDQFFVSFNEKDYPYKIVQRCSSDHCACSPEDDSVDQQILVS